MNRRLSTHNAQETRDYGQALATVLRAGDLVIVSGDLGAGKTTFVQGIGAGLNVAGTIASPTYTIARSHPPRHDGPGLVHVDAYRLESLTELDHLDLDTELTDNVTVVEWGHGMVEHLATDRVEVTLHRPRGTTPNGGDTFTDNDTRTIEVTAIGPRWAEVHLP